LLLINKPICGSKKKNNITIGGKKKKKKKKIRKKKKKTRQKKKGRKGSSGVSTPAGNDIILATVLDPTVKPVLDNNKLLKQINEQKIENDKNIDKNEKFAKLFNSVFRATILMYEDSLTDQNREYRALHSDPLNILTNKIIDEQFSLRGGIDGSIQVYRTNNRNNNKNLKYYKLLSNDLNDNILNEVEKYFNTIFSYFNDEKNYTTKIIYKYFYYNLFKEIIKIYGNDSNILCAYKEICKNSGIVLNFNYFNENNFNENFFTKNNFDITKFKSNELIEKFKETELIVKLDLKKA
jgi:hypothetical protein